ncbi:50S ribosomal protein L30 [candidate division KSB1 bacterium]|nr:50S ribosomal protein L30 [candidate division KSB1 bacterium]
MPKKSKKDTGTIKITQFKSAIGYTKRQKLTIEALGIRRLGQVKEHKDTPEIRGMVRKISHLVRIIEG